MGVRFRRSIKIAPGVRLNVTKTGVGATAGGRYARYSVHSSGRKTVGLGVPGTGSYYQKSLGGGSSGGPASRGARGSQSATSPLWAIPKPGLLAGGAERAYHQGIMAYVAGDHAAALEAFDRVLASDPAVLSAHLFAAIEASGIGDSARSISHLEAVVSSPTGLPDRYQAKYVASSTFDLALRVRITDSILATPPFSELAAALALAEAYQSAGRLEEAIGLMQQLYETLGDPLLRLSLCDLLYADGDHEAVLETSAGVTNDSDIEVEILHLRGAALVATGHAEGAVETFKSALSKTSGRDPGLLNAVRYDRALVLEQLGQLKKSRQDLERVYAADPAFEDVRERLAAMA